MIRVPVGGQIGAMEHHQESPEVAILAHPRPEGGLGSSPIDAYWGIQQAIRSDDPVLFFEPKKLYHSGALKMEVDTDASPSPVFGSRVVREGTAIRRPCPLLVQVGLLAEQDTVPGIKTELHITPNKIGTYPVICTELCGLGHAVMRSQTIVMSQSDFDKWLKDQTKATGSTDTGAAGAAVFKNNGCGACHTLTAAKASGKVGPDLDKLPHVREERRPGARPVHPRVDRQPGRLRGEGLPRAHDAAVLVAAESAARRTCSVSDRLEQEGVNDTP